MFNFFSDDKNAINILKQDHDNVKELFNQFENAENIIQKRRIVEDTLEELKIHTVIEEEIFYPAIRLYVGRKLMNEADEEHHVAKVLIAELEEMTGMEEHYDAKYKVLSEKHPPPYTRGRRRYIFKSK